VRRIGVQQLAVVQDGIGARLDRFGIGGDPTKRVFEARRLGGNEIGAEPVDRLETVDELQPAIAALRRADACARDCSPLSRN